MAKNDFASRLIMRIFKQTKYDTKFQRHDYCIRHLKDLYNILATLNKKIKEG